MAQMPVLVVLAGGSSSRMWPLHEKLLLRFGTEPLLVSQLRRFEALGLQETVVIASAENVEDVKSLVGHMTSMSIRVVVQPEAKGMGDALLQAAPALPSRPGTALYVVQIHDVTDDDLHSAMLAAYQQDPTATYLAGYEMDEYFPGGYLIVDANGRINGIIEKPGAENRPSNLVSIVAHIHSNAEELLDALRAEYASAIQTDDHYERAMDALMKERVYRVVPYRGPWKALKYPWHVLDVMEYFLAKIKGQSVAESAYVAPTATLIGDVYIGENVKIFPGASVVGPAYIGANTIIGNNALVRQSMVLTSCNVGFTTEVARSYVGDHVDMHACRVLDSVFASGVNFSAGCTTANLRIDHGHVPSMVKGARIDSGRDKFGAIIGQDTFISVDVMTMPGVKIGARAQVGPGTHVHQDVRDGGRIYVKQELIVKDE